MRLSTEKLKKATAVVLSVTTIFSMAACGGGKSTVKATDSNEIEQIVEANQPESGEYDPAGAAGYVYFTLQSYCLEGLIGYDAEGKIIPKSAESWEISEDLLTYTFHLRDGLKWSDGSALTSADFKNTMVRALDPNRGSWYVDFLFVIKGAKAAFNGEGSMDDVGIECPDDKTIKITLEQPCSYFLDLCKLPTYMPSCSKYATNEDADWSMSPETNLGNGPYHLVERKPGESLTFEKNPYYYDASNVTVLKIVDRFMDDDQAKSSAYQTGEVNIVQGAPSSIAESYEGKPDLIFREVPQTNYILFNIGMKPFDDVRVRQAFSLAVNRKDIAAVVGKSCEPSTTIVGKNYKSKIDGTKWSELQGDLLSEDLAKAKELLKEAGYENGVGLPELTYTYPAMSYEADVAQVLQQEWKELGVTVKLEAMEYEVYVNARRNGELMMARAQWYADYNDPTSWLAMFIEGNAQNDVKWTNEKYNQLMEESDKELDDAKRQKLLQAAEKILVTEETVVCPLFSNSNTDLIDPTLENYSFDVLSYSDWSHMTKKKN